MISNWTNHAMRIEDARYLINIHDIAHRSEWTTDQQESYWFNHDPEADRWQDTQGNAFQNLLDEYGYSDDYYGFIEAIQEVANWTN